jgi:uncharacterized protein (TIGR02117 family)
MNQPHDLKPKQSLFQKFRRVIWRCGKWLFIVVIAYVVLCLVGLIPVNNNFRNVPNGIEIVIVSNAVHSDIVLPIHASGFNWLDRLPTDCFEGDPSVATHVAIGWGDTGFFIETPTWNELKISTAANALLWPSQTCMHVVLADKIWIGNDGVTIRVSEAQYLDMVTEICATFKTDSAGKFVQIPGARYDWSDAFFQANGTYHLFNTCNSWIGRIMRKGGVRVGWFTPLPKTVFLWLPE